MHLRVIVVILALSLAGCTDSEPSEPETSNAPEAPPATPPEAPPEPSDPEPTPAPANKAPTLDLSASFENGTAPLTTTITVLAGDPDDDTIAWTIDLGDDGVDAEGFGARGEHVVTLEAGNYTVVATVSDGQELVEDTLQIIVSEPPIESQSVAGSVIGQSTACTEDAEWSSGEGYVEFTLIPGTIGHPYFLEFPDEVSAYMRVAFLLENGTIVEQHFLGIGQGVEAGEVDDGDWELEGIVPEAHSIVLITCGNAGGADFSDPYTYDAGPA